MRLYSEKRILQILHKQKPWIRTLSKRYGVPSSVIQAVLFKEMSDIDLMDVLADLAVFSGLFSKKDSSTGYGQIFGAVALRAALEASKEGLASLDKLGVGPLRAGNEKDVRRVWKKLFLDPRANIEFSTLNLLSCAKEMTGRRDFSSFSPEELKKTLTRYNASVDHVTAYGEKTYALVQRFEKEEKRA